MPGYSWWDLYNVSSFFHSLGYDVFIHSMPLKGVNVGPGSNATYLNTDHCTPRAAAASALCVPRRPARPVPKLTSLASCRGRTR